MEGQEEKEEEEEEEKKSNFQKHRVKLVLKNSNLIQVAAFENFLASQTQNAAENFSKQSQFAQGEGYPKTYYQMIKHLQRNVNRQCSLKQVTKYILQQNFSLHIIVFTRFILEIIICENFIFQIMRCIHHTFIIISYSIRTFLFQ